MKRLDISDTEYEEARTAFELVNWLGEKFIEMELSGGFDDIYWERKGRNVKKLVEEAVPMSRLAMFLSSPYNTVLIKLNSGNNNYDAVIEISHSEHFPIFENRKFKVEISTTETESSTMRRQALSRQGIVPLTGGLSRDGRKIIPNEFQFVSTAELEQDIVNILFERFKRKVTSRKYDRETTILIHSSDPNPLSIHSRARLVRQTRRYILENTPDIRDVYFTYFFSNIVDSVKFYER